MSVVHVVIRRCPGGSGGRRQCSGARPREAGDARPGGGVRGSTGRSARARPTWRRPHGNDRFHMPGRGAVAERDAVPAAATDQGASRVAPNRTTLIFLARFVTRREKAWTRQRGPGTSASSSAISSERWLYFDNDKVPLCSEGARSMYHEVRILVANAVREVRVASLVDFPMECV